MDQLLAEMPYIVVRDYDCTVNHGNHTELELIAISFSEMAEYFANPKKLQEAREAVRSGNIPSQHYGYVQGLMAIRTLREQFGHDVSTLLRDFREMQDEQASKGKQKNLMRYTQ